MTNLAIPCHFFLNIVVTISWVPPSPPWFPAHSVLLTLAKPTVPFLGFDNPYGIDTSPSFLIQKHQLCSFLPAFFPMSLLLGGLICLLGVFFWEVGWLFCSEFVFWRGCIFVLKCFLNSRSE